MDAQTKTAPAAATTDQLWYKDAIIYQLHVKSFFDSNDDGIGDFPGLISKLDYIADLGANAIWLLPFYPSPRLDDGYDISEYREVHPDYGTLADFRHFVRAGTRARHARDHRTRGQSHLRPASVVSARPARQAWLALARLSMSGRIPIRNMPERGSYSSTASARIGPGIRSPVPTIGIASIRISPI